MKKQMQRVPILVHLCWLKVTTILGRFVYTGIFEANPMASDWISIQNGPTPHPMITDPPPTDSAAVPAPREKLDSEFSEEENKLEMADTQAEIILSQGNREDYSNKGRMDCLMIVTERSWKALGNVGNTCAEARRDVLELMKLKHSSHDVDYQHLMINLKALTYNNMFQANHEDAYDSDVDEGPIAAVLSWPQLVLPASANQQPRTSREQAYWLPANERIIKERTTQKPDYVSEWCFDYAKQFVEQQLGNTTKVRELDAEISDQKQVHGTTDRPIRSITAVLFPFPCPKITMVSRASYHLNVCVIAVRIWHVNMQRSLLGDLLTGDTIISRDLLVKDSSYNPYSRSDRFCDGGLELLSEAFVSSSLHSLLAYKSLFTTCHGYGMSVESSEFRGDIDRNCALEKSSRDDFNRRCHNNDFVVVEEALVSKQTGESDIISFSELDYRSTTCCYQSPGLSACVIFQPWKALSFSVYACHLSLEAVVLNLLIHNIALEGSSSSLATVDS
ncbi:hypothetical protein Tco_0822568 [Tanacetum coccineum]|uniref:Uncharacterized protein n=1 Tax=Tanacetum coccineum TaxID=301880 RepID=A0ABQ5AHA2_9ASTR